MAARLKHLLRGAPPRGPKLTTLLSNHSQLCQLQQTLEAAQQARGLLQSSSMRSNSRAVHGRSTWRAGLTLKQSRGEENRRRGHPSPCRQKIGLPSGTLKRDSLPCLPDMQRISVAPAWDVILETSLLCIERIAAQWCVMLNDCSQKLQDFQHDREDGSFSIVGCLAEGEDKHVEYGSVMTTSMKVTRSCSVS